MRSHPLTLSHPCAPRTIRARRRNSQVVLGRSLWREVLRYVLVLLIAQATFTAIDVAVVLTCTARGAAAVADAELVKAECLASYAPLNDLARAVLLVCGLVWAILIGGPRRKELRRALGIPDNTPEGSCCRPCQVKGVCDDDCCLHYYCLCCAVAQETRTRMEWARAQAAAAAASEARAALLEAPHTPLQMARSDDGFLV